MKRFKCCYLHIGTEKTGTTTIQEFLSQNNERLIKQGHYFPKCLGPHSNHYYLVVAHRQDEVMDDMRVLSGVNTKEKLDSFRKELAESFDDEMSNLPNTIESVHISSENFHSRLLDSLSIRSLKNFLSKYFDKVIVICYLRPQHELAVSLYSTALKLGAKPEKILPAVSAGNDYYNYLNLVKRWADVFSKSSLRIKIFDKHELKHQDLCEDYCALTELDANLLNKTENKNKSLSQCAIRYLELVNPFLPRVVDGKPSGLRKDISDVLEYLSPGKGPTISKADAIQFYSIFHEDNSKLAKEFLNKNELFSIDFNKYPLETSDVCTDEDFGRFLAKLWMMSSVDLSEN